MARIIGRQPSSRSVIVPAEHAEAADLRRWFSEAADIRYDAGVAEEVLAFIDAAGARSIVMTDRIIGCPHWPDAISWTGKRLH